MIIKGALLITELTDKKEGPTAENNISQANGVWIKPPIKVYVC